MGTVNINSLAAAQAIGLGSDIGLDRDSAGVLGVTDGSTGYGDIKAKGAVFENGGSLTITPNGVADYNIVAGQVASLRVLNGPASAWSPLSALTLYANKLGLGPTGSVDSGADAFLERDAANTVAQRNGTNPQTFNIANTWTDASNNEIGGLRWSSNVLELFADAAGTGTARNIAINYGDHGFAPVDFHTPASNLGEMRFYRPSTGGIGGRFSWSNGGFSLFGGSAGTSSDSKITLGSNRIVLDPNPGGASSSEYKVFLAEQGVATAVTRTLQADNNTNRARGGHHLKLEGGNAYDGGATNRDGGDVIVTGGDPANSGSRGNIILENLPTSNPGVTGALWNDAGTLKIS